MARDQDNGHLSRILNSAEPAVIRRGKEYLARDLVAVTEQIQGTWVGIARGSELYALTLNTNTGKYSCTCPAARPCKHVVAFVLLLRRDFQSGQSANIHQGLTLNISEQDLQASEETAPHSRKSGDGPSHANRGRLAAKAIEFLPLKFVLNEQSETLKLHFSLTGSISVLPAVLHPDHARLWQELRKEFGYPMQLPLSRASLWKDLEPEVEILDLNGRSLRFRGELSVRPALRELSPLDSRRVLVPCVSMRDEERWPRSGQTCIVEPGGAMKERGFWVMKYQEVSPALHSMLHTVLEPEQILSSLKLLKKEKVLGLEPFEQICKAGPVLRISLDYSIDTDLWLHGEMDLVYARHQKDLKPEYMEQQPDGPVQRPVYPSIAGLAPFWPAADSAEESFYAMGQGQVALRNPDKEKRLLSRLASQPAISSIFDFSRLWTESSDEWTGSGGGRIAVFDDGSFSLNGAALQDFMIALPALLDSGIRVEFSRELIRLFRPAPRARFEIDKPSGIEWFSGRILLPGLSRSEQDRVFDAYRDGRGYAEIRSGQWISLEQTGLSEIENGLSGLGLNLDPEGLTRMGPPQWLALQSELSQQLQTTHRMQKFLERFELQVPAMPVAGF
ncbi:MAG: hypothetical protein KDK23_12665, partial [Leptospiraceae bacterium]|nr:hypothetical protein [Leptospiraceae bacterium]